MIPQTKPWDVQNRIETNEQELNGVNEVLDLRVQGTIEKGAKKREGHYKTTITLQIL